MIPCMTTHLLVNMHYLDLSDNLLTDLTLAETLCKGDGTLKDLRVLNISGNPLQVLLPTFFSTDLSQLLIMHSVSTVLFTIWLDLLLNLNIRISRSKFLCTNHMMNSIPSEK